ncbi:MAG: hypothetical protein WAQ53_03350 [Thiofilum sp.]|uniref:hypothetical protein n=1 Tax=Thiofilum sp. TaxID=2212733 RepID=UPI0025EA89F5|nr:hypothetical protein [Thiofilum sp.]MBK8454727.1 hypothetical protein [Thiofilum sp.]
MSTLVKRLVIGVLLGVLIVFAVVGIKSTLQRPTNTPVPNATTTNPVSTAPAPATTQSTALTSNTTTNVPAPAPDATVPTPPAEQPSIIEPTSQQDVAQTPDTGLPQVPTLQGTPQASIPPAQQPTPNNVPQPPAPTQSNTTTVTTPQMVDIPAPAPVLGKLQLVLIDPANLDAKPKGNFIITDSQDVQVAMQQNSDVGLFELPPGTYKATVSINGKRNTRTVQIVGNQTKMENFTLPPSMTTPPATATDPAPSTNEPPLIQEGTLQVIVKAAGSGQAVRANIYVQKPNGVHIASKTYTTSADFLLEPGTYKITVKAKDKADLIQEIKINQDKATRVTFNMQALVNNAPVLKPAPTLPNTPAQSSTPPVAPPPVVTLPEPELNKPILEPIVPPLTSSEDPRLKPRPIPNNPAQPFIPPPGSEIDTVQNQGEEPQFVTPMGSLELHAVSGIDNSPLAVDFTVTDLRGNVLERFRRVAIAELSLPAQDVLVNIHYQGMRGRETIRVQAGAPTVYTFTVTPNDYEELTN